MHEIHSLEERVTNLPRNSEFTPVSPNPYIVGNPVRDRAMFFGREAEFELVRKRFQDSSRGGLLVFCGERRSGKTSILFQILDQRLGPDFISVLIDMQSMAVGNEAEFLGRLSEEVLAVLGPDARGIPRPTYPAGSNHAATFQKFIQDVLRVHPDKKLILLFDEYELFENKIDSGLLAEDVLHVLAGLMENKPVFLIFTGSQHLEQRRREYWKILGKSIYKMISFLEREDALKLIRRPVEGRIRYSEDAVEEIYRLTAGQAFYTQAICQSLVDHLNELRSSEAVPTNVAKVVNGIVNNPLPQMIFLWDGLERDEKIVLALLAESLGEESAFSSADSLKRLLRARDYPLGIDRPQIATSLEKLFKAEMLLRDDRTTPPGYAFRMDLWRLWIRRQHSVWQVMREEGLEIRPTGWRHRLLRPATGVIIGFAVIIVLAVALTVQVRSKAPSRALLAPPGAGAGRGADSAHREIPPPPRDGSALVVTNPPGARVSVDGARRGRSPILVAGLNAGQAHVLMAEETGYEAGETTFDVRSGDTAAVRLDLVSSRAEFVVTTDPPGAALSVDGSLAGATPHTVGDVAQGRHRLVARLAGYLPADSMVEIAGKTSQVHLRLVPEPPGYLVVQGDKPAQIYIDGTLVVENVQNSGPRELPGGAHQVRVILLTGETVDYAVTVKSRERAVYDYSKGTVTRRPQGESDR